jgi:RES domain-containing protein
VNTLPPPLGQGGLNGWRIDLSRYALEWSSGEEAFRFGGRWNRPGTRAMYASVDPATALVEVAVHKGFEALGGSSHVLTSFVLPTLDLVKIVHPDNIPEKVWLRRGMPTPEGQAFGDALLAAAAFTLIPSVVSPWSWTLLANPLHPDFDPRDIVQRELLLDPRLTPPRS